MSVFITEHGNTAWLLYWGTKKIKKIKTKKAFVFIQFVQNIKSHLQCWQ